MLMQSNLGNGDSQAVGQACLLTFTLSAALVFAEGITPDLAAPYRELAAAVVTRIAPDLLAEVKPPKAARRRQAPAEGTGDVSRETSPAVERDANLSVAEAAVNGLEVRLARAGHSSPGDE